MTFDVFVTRLPRPTVGLPINRVQVSEGADLASFKSAVEQECGVPIAEQVLLVGGVRLPSDLASASSPLASLGISRCSSVILVQERAEHPLIVAAREGRSEEVDDRLSRLFEQDTDPTACACIVGEAFAVACSGQNFDIARALLSAGGPEALTAGPLRGQKDPLSGILALMPQDLLGEALAERRVTEDLLVEAAQDEQLLQFVLELMPQEEREDVVRRAATRPAAANWQAMSSRGESFEQMCWRVLPKQGWSRERELWLGQKKSSTSNLFLFSSKLVHAIIANVCVPCNEELQVRQIERRETVPMSIDLPPATELDLPCDHEDFSKAEPSPHPLAYLNFDFKRNKNLGLVREILLGSLDHLKAENGAGMSPTWTPATDFSSTHDNTGTTSPWSGNVSYSSSYSFSEMGKLFLTAQSTASSRSTVEA